MPQDNDNVIYYSVRTQQNNVNLVATGLSMVVQDGRETRYASTLA